VDFAGFTLIFHCSIQFWSELRCCCSFWEAVIKMRPKTGHFSSLLSVKGTVRNVL
jgi:hypothetical protein